MKLIRIVGAIVALAGSGMFTAAIYNSLPRVSGSSGLGVIALNSLVLGLAMIVVGICIVIIAGRFNKKLP